MMSLTVTPPTPQGPRVIRGKGWWEGETEWEGRREAAEESP